MTQTIRETIGSPSSAIPPDNRFHPRFRGDAEYPAPAIQIPAKCATPPIRVRMLLDQCIFVRIQFAWLSENRVWNSHFPDVVQQCLPLPGCAVCLHRAQAPGQPQAPFRKPRAVHSRIQVLQVEKLVEGANHRMRRLATCSSRTFTRKPPATDQRPPEGTDNGLPGFNCSPADEPG